MNTPTSRSDIPLTSAQKVIAAYLRLVKGLKVEDIAIAMDVTLYAASVAIRDICVSVGEPVETRSRSQGAG